MKIPFHNRLFGYYEVETDKKYRMRLINLFLKHRIVAHPKEPCRWVVAAHHASRLMRLAREEEIPLSRSALLGAPSFFLRYLRRPGISLGICLFCFLLFVGSRYVWRVEVEGNERVPDAVIEENLKSLGFGVGTPFHRVDLSALAEEYRTSFSHVSYMSVYMKGTVARVKVQETDSADVDESEEALPSHLVASRDAVIYRMDVSHGTPVVSVGQVVKKGDVLVSGLVTGAHADTLLAADGRVFGEVSETVLVEISYKQTHQHIKKHEKQQISINFFGKTINIFTNTGKMDQTYGTIERDKIWYLPNGVPLPVSLSVTDRVYYESEEEEIGYAAALRLAQAELKTRLSLLLGEGELLGKIQSVTVKDGKLVLCCTVRYTANIADTVPITGVPR